MSRSVVIVVCMCVVAVSVVAVSVVTVSIDSVSKGAATIEPGSTFIPSGTR